MAGLADVFIQADGREPKQATQMIGRDAKIKIIGVGGGGINALAHVIRSGLSGAGSYAVDSGSDTTWIDSVTPEQILVIADGKGTNGDPAVGACAAVEACDEITKALNGCDVVVISACMGGGTGSGAAPVIAKFAHELGILTAAVVTLPFQFEGRVRSSRAAAGIEVMKESVDVLLAIPNDRLSAMSDKKGSLVKMFAMADNVLLKAVQGIIDTVNKAGHVDRSELIKAIGDLGHALYAM